MQNNTEKEASGTLVYFLLIGLTLLTWSIAKADLSGLTVSLAVLALSLVKGHLIGDYFMRLKTVSSRWRWVITAWLFIPGSLIMYAFIS